MEVSVNQHAEGIAVVAPQARIDVYSVPGLRECLDRLLSQGIANFVIDLSGVPFLDSAGLALLVTLLKRTREVNGDVVLVWPRAEGPRRMLQLTKFDRVFTIVDGADVATTTFVSR